MNSLVWNTKRVSEDGYQKDGTQTIVFTVTENVNTPNQYLKNLFTTYCGYYSATMPWEMTISTAASFTISDGGNNGKTGYMAVLSGIGQRIISGIIYQTNGALSSISASNGAIKFQEDSGVVTVHFNTEKVIFAEDL